MTAERPLSILHLAANRWWTGSADPTIQLAVALRARGHRVLLGLIPGDRFETKAREAGLEVVQGLRLEARAGGLIGDLRRLHSLVGRERIDVVHAHHSHDHWLAVLARPARGGRGPTPVVRTFHNARSVHGGWLAAALYRRTAAVFVASRQIEARCHAVGFDASRVTCLPGTVDLIRFTPEADGRSIREEFKLGEAPVVVSVARLAPNRGHELLLQAFRELLATLPEARLLLVGKGEMRSRLEQRVAQLSLGERVVFAGYRDRDLAQVLAAADCFALMAAGSDESCRAALEAMAAGRPVIARRVGALPETVVDGVTGILLADDLVESVARALLSVLGDRGRARAMGAAARRRAEAFGPDRVVELVEPVYRSLG